MEETIRYLVFVGFASLLVLLRLDAGRFGTAEYHDESVGGIRVWLRRLAWFALAIGLIVAIYRIHRQPISVLQLQLGDDRQQAVTYGLAAGLLGTLVALVFAWWRYRRFRLPPARHYPGAALNAVGTAFVDEALFRGIMLGLLLGFDWPVELAIAFQAVAYGLATRLGAPGRSISMLLLSIGLGAVAGFLTVETGGIGAAVVAHAVTRFAIFLATGHAGQVRLHAPEPEERLGVSLPPDGWEIVVDPTMPDAAWPPYPAAPRLGSGGEPGPRLGPGGEVAQGSLRQIHPG
jgi:hypothetical protein